MRTKTISSNSVSHYSHHLKVVKENFNVKKMEDKNFALVECFVHNKISDPPFNSLVLNLKLLENRQEIIKKLIIWIGKVQQEEEDSIDVPGEQIVERREMYGRKREFSCLDSTS